MKDPKVNLTNLQIQPSTENMNQPIQQYPTYQVQQPCVQNQVIYGQPQQVIVAQPSLVPVQPIVPLDTSRFDNAHGISYCCCSTNTSCCNYIVSVVFMWIFSIPLFVTSIIGNGKSYKSCLITGGFFSSLIGISITEFIFLLIYSIGLCIKVGNTKTQRIIKSAVRMVVSLVMWILCFVLEIKLLNGVTGELNNLANTIDEVDDDYYYYYRRRNLGYVDDVVDCTILFIYGIVGLSSFSWAEPIIFVLTITDIIRLVKTIKEQDGVPMTQFGTPTPQINEVPSTVPATNNVPNQQAVQVQPV